jgi:hypothetical protein
MLLPCEGRAEEDTDRQAETYRGGTGRFKTQAMTKKELRDFSPLANYTDRAIAAGQRS